VRKRWWKIYDGLHQARGGYRQKFRGQDSLKLTTHLLARGGNPVACMQGWATYVTASYNAITGDICLHN